MDNEAHAASAPNSARASPSRAADGRATDGDQEGDGGSLLPHPFQVGLSAPTDTRDALDGRRAGPGAEQAQAQADQDQAEQSVEALLHDAIERSKRASTSLGHGATQHQQQHEQQGGGRSPAEGAVEQAHAQVDHLELIRQASLGAGAAASTTTATTNDALPDPPPAAPAAGGASASPSASPSASSRPAKGPGSRARWTPAEDARLIELVKVDPPLTWNEIGARMGRPPTGCGMRWYKFLRERVGDDEGAEEVGDKDRSGQAQQEQQQHAQVPAQRQQQAQDADPQAAASTLSGANGLHPSGDMIVGGSSGQHDHAVFQPGPSGSPPHPAVPLAYVPADQLPPALPPAADLAGHPFPRDVSPTTKVHSNAGAHYLPATALVAQPPIPFKKNQVLRGRRTKDPKVLEEEMKALQEAARRRAEEMRAQSAAAEGDDDDDDDDGEGGRKKKKGAARPRGKGSAGGLGAKGGTSKGGSVVHTCPAENCTAAFKRSEHLRRHYKAVHRGEKPFPCTVADCGKAFSRKDNLQQHQAMVHFVKALYHYPDGTTSTDPPEPGQEGVTTTFEAVDISKTPRGAQKLSRIKGKQEERAKEAKKLADERGRGDKEGSAASADGAGPSNAASSSSSHAKGVPPYVRGLIGASGVMGAPSMSPSPAHEREASSSNGSQYGDAVAGHKRGRSADDSDAGGGGDADSDDVIDKRLRLIDPSLGGSGDALGGGGGGANGGFYSNDPALQALAAQVHHHHAHAHGAGHDPHRRSMTPSTSGGAAVDYDSATAQQQQRDLLSALQRMSQQVVHGAGVGPTGADGVGDDHHLELRPDFIVPGLEAFLNQHAAEAAQHGAGGGGPGHA